MAKRRNAPTRTTKTGEEVCGAWYQPGLRKRYSHEQIKRFCVRHPGHAGLHRSYETRDHKRYFWNDDNEVVRVITEEAWQEEAVNIAVRMLRETLASFTDG